MAIFVASPRPSAWSRYALALFAIQLGALALFTRPSVIALGFPLDDAWIHQLLARRLAETGALGIDPARFASGASSVLWPALLALNPALFAAPPPVFSAALNALLYLASGQLLFRVLVRDGLRTSAAAGAAALASLAANHAWFVFSGMEATLLVFLALAAVYAWLTPQGGARSAFASGGLLALGFLTRPEAAVFAAPLVLSVRAVGRPLRHVLFVVLPAALALAAYLMNSAGVLPSTVGGRRWMLLHYGQGVDPLVFAREFGERWAERLARYSLGVPVPELFWIATGLAGLGVIVSVRDRFRGAVLLASLAALHVLVYTVSMPTEGHGGRYQPLVPAAFLAFVFIGLAELARAAALRFRPPVGAAGSDALAAAVLALPVLLALRGFGRDHEAAVRHIAETEVRMGRHLHGLPATARVGSFDLGGIGYFSERPILDLGALVDPSVLPLLKAGRADQLLLDRHIDYVVVPMGYSDEFPDFWNFKERLSLGATGTLELTKLLEYRSELAVWKSGLEATLHCAPRQVLYRLARAPVRAQNP